MKASDHTERMLGWWARIGIDRADLAVRRADGTMLWQRDIDLEELPLSWARAENVRRGEVFIRPARGRNWPVIFLDDVEVGVSKDVARKYAALVVRSSAEGGCHVWLRCSSSLCESDRREAQIWVAKRVGADPASVSGEHLGRFAGFKNWKRDGEWVNVLEASIDRPDWNPSAAFDDGVGWPVQVEKDVASGCVQNQDRRLANVDRSESGKEWGWVMGALEAGMDPESVRARLAERARKRRGKDADRYARHTVARAMRTGGLFSPPGGARGSRSRPGGEPEGS